MREWCDNHRPQIPVHCIRRNNHRWPCIIYFRSLDWVQCYAINIELMHFYHSFRSKSFTICSNGFSGVLLPFLFAALNCFSQVERSVLIPGSLYWRMKIIPFTAWITTSTSAFNPDASMIGLPRITPLEFPSERIRDLTEAFGRTYSVHLIGSVAFVPASLLSEMRLFRFDFFAAGIFLNYYI